MIVYRLVDWLLTAFGRVTASGRERGDVPGWVMITVMTAALVLAILIPFREAIIEAVDSALTSVIDGSQSGS